MLTSTTLSTYLKRTLHALAGEEVPYSCVPRGALAMLGDKLVMVMYNGVVSLDDGSRWTSRESLDNMRLRPLKPSSAVTLIVR